MLTLKPIRGLHRQLAGFLAGAAAAFLILFLTGRWSLPPAPLLLAGLVSLPPVILIHELGHAVMAWIVGWRVAVIVVGPFWLRIAPLGLRLRREASVDGRTFNAPRHAGQHTRGRILALLAGGGLANLLSGGLAVWGARQLPPFGAAALAGFGLVSLFIGLSNLIPAQLKSGAANDGLRILTTLLRPLPDAALAAARATVLGQSMSGVAAKDWDAASMALLQARPDDEAGLSALMLFDYHNGFGRTGEARAALDRAKARYGDAPAMRTPLIVIEAFFLARMEHDPDRAQALLDTAPPRARKLYDYHRAQAAIPVARGDHGAALAAIRAARRMLPRALPFIRENEIALLDEMARELDPPLAKAA
ncbi:MAG TPA: hypothetical protein VGF56_09250 [Rhizomicrobium sp.]|jgi:hypothetical protein